MAVGRLVQAVSDSRYAADTLIVVTEDDCQDGPDHVDSHRATCPLPKAPQAGRSEGGRGCASGSEPHRR